MHPILAEFGDNFFLGTYGLMIAIGLFLAVGMAAYRGRNRGIQSEVFYDLMMIAVISGFIGARILFILTDLGGFLRDPMPYILSRSGFVFLGGLIAAAAACSYYIMRKGLDFWKIADILVPSLALGHAFGRIGCHLAGCCYGGVCDIGGACITVPRIVVQGEVWPNAFYDHLRENLIPPDAVHSLPIWPVQLMESGALFLLTAVLVLLAMRPHRKGLILGIYFVAYSILRFTLEFLRGDEGRGVYFDNLLSTSQILSFALFFAGVAVLVITRKNEVYAPAKPKEKQETPERKKEATKK